MRIAGEPGPDTALSDCSDCRRRRLRERGSRSDRRRAFLLGRFRTRLQGLLHRRDGCARSRSPGIEPIARPRIEKDRCHAARPCVGFRVP